MKCMMMFCILGARVLSGSASAGIVNGGFETDPVGFGGCPVTTPTGWTGGFLCGHGYYGATPPEGLNFAIIGGGSDYPSGSLSQTITSLTSGHSYTVTFDLGGENWSTSTTEQVQVSMLSGSSTASQTYNVPHSTCNGCAGNTGLWTNWSAFNYTFLATGTSAAIKFMDVSSAANDTGIDNVSVADTTGGGGVPEPGTLLLFGIGVGCVSLLRYRNRQQRS